MRPLLLALLVAASVVPVAAAGPIALLPGDHEAWCGYQEDTGEGSGEGSEPGSWEYYYWLAWDDSCGGSDTVRVDAPEGLASVEARETSWTGRSGETRFADVYGPDGYSGEGAVTNASGTYQSTTVAVEAAGERVVLEDRCEDMETDVTRYGYGWDVEEGDSWSWSATSSTVAGCGTSIRAADASASTFEGCRGHNTTYGDASAAGWSYGQSRESFCGREIAAGAAGQEVAVRHGERCAVHDEVSSAGYAGSYDCADGTWVDAGEVRVLLGEDDGYDYVCTDTCGGSAYGGEGLVLHTPAGYRAVELLP